MYVVETTSGSWEGDSLKEIAKDMADSYAENDGYLPSVKSILYVYEANRNERYLDKIIPAFEQEAEEQFEHAKEAYDDQEVYEREVRETYYSNCL